MALVAVCSVLSSGVRQSSCVASRRCMRTLEGGRAFTFSCVPYWEYLVGMIPIIENLMEKKTEKTLEKFVCFLQFQAECRGPQALVAGRSRNQARCGALLVLAEPGG